MAMGRMAFIIAQLLLVACSPVAQMWDTGKARVIDRLKGRLTPVVGLGYRRVVSHTAGVDDLNCFYAKIVFKF